MAACWYTRAASPVAPLLLAAGADGALSALWLVPDDDGDGPPRAAPGARRDDAPFREALDQLAGYFAGERTAFALELRLEGTPFQQRVWHALQEIPYGTTTTYGELAGRLGLGRAASRAVGLANGRNPVSIVVPCHRVIGADGSLTGYGGGLPRKAALLAHEGVGLVGWVA